MTEGQKLQSLTMEIINDGIAGGVEANKVGLMIRKKCALQ